MSAVREGAVMRLRDWLGLCAVMLVFAGTHFERASLLGLSVAVMVVMGLFMELTKAWSSAFFFLSSVSVVQLWILWFLKP